MVNNVSGNYVIYIYMCKLRVDLMYSSCSELM